MQRIGDLESRIAMLQQVKAVGHPNSATYQDELDQDATTARTALNTATTNLENGRFDCQRALAGKKRKKQNTATEECDKLEGLESAVAKALAEDASATSAVAAARNEYGANSILQSQISSTITFLQSQVNQYRNQLSTAPGAVPGYVADANGTRELTPAEQEDQWTAFEFDSTQASKSVSSDSRSYKASLSFGFRGGLWSVSGGASYSRSTSKFSQDISQANVKIRAKFLRVQINRPWLRTTLFKNRDLTSVSMPCRIFIFTIHLFLFIPPLSSPLSPPHPLTPSPSSHPSISLYISLVKKNSGQIYYTIKIWHTHIPLKYGI